MGQIKERTIEIPLNALENVETFFFRQIQMDGKRVLKKFPTQYEETKKTIFEQVRAKGILASFSIEKREEDALYLEGGEKIVSKMLCRAFRKSTELVLCAVTLHGYDAIEAEETNNIKTLFYDGWGTALADSGFAWLKKQLRAELEQEGIYGTNSWSPGQHNVDIALQKPLFRLLHLQKIGITLNQSCMMHPKKSISGFFGIGPEPETEQIRACDFCERRETCPSAYA